MARIGMIANHPDLFATLTRLNAAWHGSGDLDAQREAEALFSAGHHLITYGSLAPGRTNHAQVSTLPGHWTSGWITGDLLRVGWGQALGFPALSWRPDGPRVDAWLLRSDHLPRHWARLDAFEGPAYQRSLVPFWTAEGIAAIGYCYTAVPDVTSHRAASAKG